MKRTQKTEAVRNIRRNLVSFLSIAIISMLAVTAYLGISFSAEGIRKSVDATYGAECFADIEISASALMTQAELETVRAAEGVADAEGILWIPSRVRNGTEVLDIAVRSVPERISLPHMLPGGRLPEAEDECAVEKTLAVKMGYKAGDRIRLAGRSKTTDAAIRTKEYTVTGVFTTGEHLTEMISFEPTILVTRGAFNAALRQGKYTRILVRAEAEEAYRFSEARKELTDRVAERLEELNGKWIVTALHNTSGYISMDANAGMLDTVSGTFSMLFVIIAALVIYTTISRLVEYDRRLTGAEKAMGLKNSEIFAKYVLFGTGGTLAGTVAGILVSFGFERFLLYCFGTVFLLGEQEMAVKPAGMVLVAAGAVLLSLAAVFAACRKLLKSTAVRLMNGEQAAGQHRAKASSGRGPLYIRLMVRNMRTDWRRVLVSIISIAGCCMLLMIGFSLKYAISRAPERQYGEIQQFGMEITAEPSALADASGGIRAALDGEGIGYTGVYTAETAYRAGDEPGMLTLICTDGGEAFSDYYRFTEAGSGKELAVPESGLLITSRFAKEYGLETGDKFVLYDSSMNAHEAEVAGIYVNYLGINTVCSRAYAEECLGEKLPDNTLLIRGEVQDPEALRQRLSEKDGFISLASARKQQALFDGMSVMLNLVILLLGILALLIAYFILLNLVSTYVNQKKNELTIMRINGYTTGETVRYASMECYGITVIGILLGLAGGQVFSNFLFGQIDQLAICFVTEPVWISFAASAAITAAISGVIHFFAFRKIRDLKLSDIQK